MRGNTQLHGLVQSAEMLINLFLIIYAQIRFRHLCSASVAETAQVLRGLKLSDLSKFDLIFNRFLIRK